MKKKFLAVILSLSLVLTTALPVMAEDNASVDAETVETEAVFESTEETEETTEPEEASGEEVVEASENADGDASENSEEANLPADPDKEESEVLDTASDSTGSAAITQDDAEEKEDQALDAASADTDSEVQNPMTGFALWWYKGYSGSAYIASTQTEGSSYSVGLRDYVPEDADNIELALSTSDESVASVSGSSFTFLKTGTVTITVSVKYNPSVKIEKTFTVVHDPDEGTVLKEASCSEAGQVQYTCQYCHEVYTEEIEKLPHTYVYENASGTDNIARRTCQVCQETETFTTMTKFYLWWWEGGNGSSGVSEARLVGDKVSVSLRAALPEDVDNEELELMTSDENVAIVSGSYITFVGEGSVTITVFAKYNPSVKIEETFTVPEKVYEGTCGEDLTWTFEEETGTLTITGSGNMSDYTTSAPASWYPLKKEIKSVKVEQGVTGIGSCAFNGYPVLESVELTDSVKKIGKYAFNSCSMLSSVLMGTDISEIPDYAIYYNSDDLVIRGWSETAAQTYAEKFDITFEEIEHTHELTEIPAKAATCTEDGNTAYWTCSICKRYYADENAAEKIKKDSWIIKSYGHDYKDGVCQNCGKTTEAFRKKQECESYEGGNALSTYNSAYGSTVESYLQTTGEDEIMRFEAYAIEGYYLVEYYDAAYNLQRTIKVAEELPLFGAYYYDGTSHYVLSGQGNRQEDDSVEVYRITKYDKDWNRIASDGLFGANTIYPFDAGSARITNSGKDMFIRTCHTMYASDDGLNHQANVTIQVDTDKMKVVDSYYDVMNASYGYVSHSFDEFIQVDREHMVGVDLGDSNPRGVVLLKYRSAYSDTGFEKDCRGRLMLSISGAYGNNATGVSIGGFELSADNYIVVGNAVTMGDDYNPSGTRNIFVSVVDKDLEGDPQVKYLTDYQEGEASPSKPQFVKISDDRFVVMWQRSGLVNYCEIDGNGNMVGNIMTMTGKLSDAVPQVINNRIVWYVWDNEKNTFYSIDINDMTDTTAQEIINGHTYEVTYPAAGENTVTRTCVDCGLEESFTTLTGFALWWWEGYYGYSYVNTNQVCGNSVEISLRDYAPENAENEELEILSSDEKVAVADGSRIDFIGAGSVTVTIRVKYNPTVKRELTFNVTHDPVDEKVIKKATYISTGQKQYTCQGCGKVVTETIAKKTQTALSKCAVTLSYTSKIYTGKALKPTVTVKKGSKTVDSKYYTVTYSNNKKVGKATVKITANDGNNPYTGAISASFKINPKGTALSSLIAVSKGFTAKWKKQATQTTGYQIQYSTSSKFTKTTTVTVKGASAVSKKITKLTGKKKYYVRIRTYRTVSKKNYYSSWSKVKAVTTKG